MDIFVNVTKPNLGFSLNTFLLFQYFPQPSFVIWGIYSLLVGLVFATIKYMNYRLHQLFDTTDCIEEIVRPIDSNVFQDRSPLPGIQSLVSSGGNRNPSNRHMSQNYHHASHHHAIQHFHDSSPTNRERAIGTRLADIQLSERGYRGGGRRRWTRWTR